MSNTAYQRATADMKAAGLNPMLAYQHGGASTPATSAPTGQAMPGSKAEGAQAQSAGNVRMENATIGGLNAAAAAAQVSNTQAQTQLAEASARERDAQAIQHTASAGQLDATRDSVRQEMTAFDARLRRIWQEVNTGQAQQYAYTGQGELSTRQANTWEKMSEAQRAMWSAQAKQYTNQARLLGLDVPKATREASFWTGPQGELAPQFEHAPTPSKLGTGLLTKGAELLDQGAKRANSAFQLKYGTTGGW